ncbi:peptidase M29 [Aerococcus urinaehominis]|uniref:Peptidase M29 n=1 Tax=Aerococcus urinaehominis TaxID=128944 RepID=A0A0X8FLK6_9LACT|nr:aminopeptidase [Aerococcus urinaehominis]AMB99556.1 peptidase M29 [Aerococcus urinaehominis]SDM35025.1 aminopeptidase [Aerococcus urinaehominis]
MSDFNHNLAKYARLLIEKGINVKKGDHVMVYIAINQAPLARLLADYAYQAGASRVYFTWTDDHLQRLDYEHVDSPELAHVPDYTIAREEDLILNKKISRLSIVSGDPDNLNGISSDKISQVQSERGQALKVRREATMKDQVKWTVAAAADYAWAKHVFPELADDEEACVAALWQAIFKTCRIDQENPIAAWDSHCRNLEAKAKYLNDQQFKALHYQAPGTNLTIGLPDQHIWTCAESFNPAGQPFIANMPTEEVFTAPDTRNIEGYVTSTKPLSYAGAMITGIKAHFKAGQITEITADTGQDIIQDLVNNNQGGRGLGEVALVPHSSPISQSNLTYYTTLFDENASNHIAIGAAYPTNIVGGEKMTDQELIDRGINRSHVHVDFMIGSPDMDIDAIDQDGNRVPIFRQGEWAF